MEEIIQTIFFEFQDQRFLLNSIPKWKIALWERSSIEPAMLRVPLVVILFLFLWVIDLYLFERSGMKYQAALSIKSGPLLYTFVVSVGLAILFGLSWSLFSNFLGLSVEVGIILFYFCLSFLLILPSLPGQENKYSFLRLLRLVFFPSPSGVTFSEVLLADALTSLSKVLKDLGVTIVAVFALQARIESVQFHEQGMVLVALLASLPFWIRIRQCWIQYDLCTDPWARLPVMLNLIKYASAFPPIWLAAAASLGYYHPNLPTLTAYMAALNSLYSYAWDVCMDWGMISFSRDGRVSFRQRFLWPLPGLFFTLALVINFVLRFSWAANRVPSLAHWPSAQLVLAVEVAEVFRRSMWALLRVEWEVVNNVERGIISPVGRDKIERLHIDQNSKSEI